MSLILSGACGQVGRRTAPPPRTVCELLPGGV